METTSVGRAALILALLVTVVACGRNKNLESSNIDPAIEPELFNAVCPDNEGETPPSWRLRVRFNKDNVPRRMLINGTSNNAEAWRLCPSSDVTWLAKKKFEICFDKDKSDPTAPFDPANQLCFESRVVSDERYQVGPLTVRADANQESAEAGYAYRVCYMKCNGQNPQWDPVIIVEN
jgi:hypothetical protein